MGGCNGGEVPLPSVGDCRAATSFPVRGRAWLRGKTTHRLSLHLNAANTRTTCFPFCGTLGAIQGRLHRSISGRWCKAKMPKLVAGWQGKKVRCASCRSGHARSFLCFVRDAHTRRKPVAYARRMRKCALARRTRGEAGAHGLLSRPCRTRTLLATYKCALRVFTARWQRSRMGNMPCLWLRLVPCHFRQAKEATRISAVGRFP